MGQLGFSFDMTACIGCKACQIACKDKNELPLGVLFRQVRTYEGGKFPNPWLFHLSSTCNHCANPKCVANCPTGALHKREDGIVDHNKERCIGCKYCTWSCPYGVPQYVEDLGKVSKCDMCKDLLAEGKNPACVDACVMRVIKYGEIDQLRAEMGAEGTSDLVIMPSSKMTNPSVTIKPRSSAKQGPEIREGV